MRAYLPAYELKVPASLSEALGLLSASPGEWRPFAGGTDLMVQLEAGMLKHRKFFSILHFDELRGIEETPGEVALGALVTYTELQKNTTMQEEFPMLCQAASETGAIAIQNRGTIGGNIANASPAADSPPALLVYDAELELVSASGARNVAYSEFHTGYKEMLMRPDELISRVRLKRVADGAPWKQYYRKVGTRLAQAISKVCFAAAARMDDDGRIADVRIALGSVAPVVLRCPKTEAALKGHEVNAEVVARAQRELASEISPINDIRSTADYRQQVAVNLLQDFLYGLK